MGEANMFFITKDYEKATEALHEVIRQAPSYAESYKLLAMIYEESGDRSKGFECRMIAAHLLPKGK